MAPCSHSSLFALRSSLFALFLGVAWSAGALAQDYTADEASVVGDIRESDLGVTRVFLDDTHYYLEVPVDVETPAEKVEDALTWSYDGQEVFEDPDSILRAEDSPGDGFEWTVPDIALTGMDADPDTYFGVGKATEVDEYGRRWILSYIDYDEARAMRDAYDRDVAATFEIEPGDPAETGWEVESTAGETMWVEPQSWSRYDCTVGGVSSTYWLDNDYAELTEGVSPTNASQRKLLLLATASCSGVMVDDEWMLTAAHCVEADAQTQVWCTMEDLEENTSGGYSATCSIRVDRHTSPNWATDPTPENDYAVIRLAPPPSPSVGWMALSDASPVTVAAHTDFLRGYPRRFPDCSQNLISDNSLTAVDTYTMPNTSVYDLFGKQLYAASGAVLSYTADIMYYTTSSARGLSGAPHFYCPTGDCGDGQYISSVNAYFSWGGCAGSSSPYTCTTGKSFGPRASAIRDWVIVNTP